MDAEQTRVAHPTYLALVERLPVTGASIAVFDIDGHQSTVWASDATAARVEELQFDLGQGPHWRALRTGVPVLINDTLADETDEWPLFGAAIAELDVRALHCFPMLLGAVTIGVVDLYCHRELVLAEVDYVLAIELTGQVAKHAVLDAVHDASGNGVGVFGSAPAMRREVHQATGIILVQLDLSATEAFFALRAHAYSSSRAMLDVAHDVISGALDFRDLPD